MALAASPSADSARTVVPPAADSARAVTGAAPPSAPADTSARVPGSAFRLGWTGERASTLGAFPVVTSSPDSVVRHGDCRWFGAEATARLTLREGRLTRVELTLEKPAPHVTSYVLDEMRREGYHRLSSSDEGKSQKSEWLGRTRASLAISDASLVGNFGTIVRDTGILAVAKPAAGDTLDFTQPSTATDTLPPPRFAFRPPNPERPAAAVQAGVFGRVMMEALVDPTGAIAALKITRGIAELDDAALGWAWQVHYVPYFSHGRATWFRIAISVPFAAQRPGPGAR